jgi:dimethylglycine dehydrogenase
MHPLINTEGIIGGLYWPDDGDVDPNGITMAMSIGAKKHGARIKPTPR